MSDLISRQQAINEILEWKTRMTAQGLVDRIAMLPSAQQDLTCSECLYFEQDHFEIVSGVPLIVAHDICMKWGGGCKTDPQGYCFMGVKK